MSKVRKEVQTTQDEEPEPEVSDTSDENIAMTSQQSMDESDDNNNDGSGDLSISSDNNNHERRRYRFPFLKDHGQDPMTTSHYFRLTLGASMSRRGDTSHLKTLQRLYPEWYNPASSKKLRKVLNSTEARATPISSRLSGSPTYKSSVSAGSSATPSPWPSAKHKFSDDYLSRQTRILEEDLSSCLGVGEDVNARKSLDVEKCWVEKQHDGHVAEPGASYESKERFGSNLLRAPSVFQFNSSPSLAGHANCPNIPSSPSSLELTPRTATPSPKISPNPQLNPTPNRQLYRPRLVRSNTANSSPSQKTSQTLRSPDVSPRNHGSRNYLKLMTNKSAKRRISPTISNQTPSITQRQRDRRSSTSSLGRRNSAVERLVGDTSKLPLLVGLDGLLQRRRRLSRKFCDTSAYMQQEVVESHVLSGLKKFQAIARTVRIITSVCLALKSHALKAETSNWSFVEMYLHLQKDITPSLAFNPHSFSKIKPPKGGRRLECLLSIPPECRTPQDIQNILAFVRTHETFQHFPANVQVKLCMVMQYQSYEPRRIILKEGHQPSAFYLVLSGSLIVNIKDTNPTTDQTFIRTTADISEGDCFGEVALLEGINRTATIMCKTTSELLVIYKEHFDSLILQPLIEQRVDDVNFCVNHVLFDELSCNAFYSHPGEFFYQYFPKETVVVADSSTCPFLILIKSGVCQVIGSYKSSTLHDGFEEWTKDEEIANDLEHAFPLYAQMRKMGLSSRKGTGNKSEEESSICKSLEEGLLMGSIDKQTLRRANGSAHPSTSKVVVDESPLILRHRSSTMSHVYDQLESRRRHLQKTQEEKTDITDEQYWSHRLTGPQLKRTRSNSLHTKGFHRKARQGQVWKLFQEDVPLFAEVATLKEGCVFGLETMVGNSGPSVSLVSQGSECILVSKRLFLQLANIKSLRVAGDLVMTFPSAASMQSKIKDNRHWEHYKTDLVLSITSHCTSV